MMCYLLNVPPPYSPAARHREQFSTALVELLHQLLLQRRLKGIHHTKETRFGDVVKNPIFSEMMRVLPHWKHQSNFPRSHWCPLGPSLITCSCFSISLGFQPSQFDLFTLFSSSTHEPMSLQLDTSDVSNSDYLDRKWTLSTDCCCPAMASSQAFWHTAVKSDSRHPKAKKHGLQTAWTDLLPASCPIQLNTYTIFRELDLLLWMIRV